MKQPNELTVMSERSALTKGAWQSNAKGMGENTPGDWLAGNRGLCCLGNQFVRQLVEFGGRLVWSCGNRLDCEARLTLAVRGGSVGFGRRLALAMVGGEAESAAVHGKRRSHSSIGGPRHRAFRLGNPWQEFRRRSQNVH